MTVSPELVRRLVRNELERRLAKTRHAALLDIIEGPECTDDLDFPIRKPCLIEPDRPCYNSGYCKKLGY